MTKQSGRDCLESVREKYHGSVTAVLMNSRKYGLRWYVLWFMLFQDAGIKAGYLEKWLDILQQIAEKGAVDVERSWRVLWNRLADNPELVVTSSPDRRQQLLTKYLSRTEGKQAPSEWEQFKAERLFITEDIWFLSVMARASQGSPQPGSRMKDKLQRRWQRKKTLRAYGEYAVWQPVYMLSNDPDEKYLVLREGLTRAMAPYVIWEWSDQEKWRSLLEAHLQQYPAHLARLREDWFKQVEKGDSDAECCAAWTGLSLIGGGEYEKRLLEIFQRRLNPWVAGERREKHVGKAEMVAMAAWCPEEMTVRDEWLAWWENRIRAFHGGHPWHPEDFIVLGACVAATVADWPEEYIGKWISRPGDYVKYWDYIGWNLKRIWTMPLGGKPDQQKGRRNLAEVVLELANARKYMEIDYDHLWNVICPYLPAGKVVERLEAFLLRKQWSAQDVQTHWLEGGPWRWLETTVNYLQKNRIGAEVTVPRLAYLTEAAFSYYTAVRSLPHIPPRLPGDLVLGLLSASLYRAAENGNTAGHNLPVRQIIDEILGTEPSAWERICRKVIRWWGDNQTLCAHFQDFWTEELAGPSLASQLNALYCLGLMVRWQRDFQASPELWERLETMVQEEKDAELFVGVALMGNHLARREGGSRIRRWARILTASRQGLTEDVDGFRVSVTWVDFRQLVRREFLLGQEGLIPSNQSCRNMKVDGTWKKIHLRRVCQMLPGLWQIDQEAGRQMFKWAGIKPQYPADLKSDLKRYMAPELGMGRPWGYTDRPAPCIPYIQPQTVQMTGTERNGRSVIADRKGMPER